jgi:transcriptional regulator with GAF, ATPase, and Fis domain
MSMRTAMLWFSQPCPSYDRIVERPTVVIQDQTVLINQFEVVVIEGPDAGMRVRSTSDELSIGTNDGNHVKLSDPTVSRHHCVLHADERGLELRDLGSRNGTFLGESEIIHAYVPTATRFRVGKTSLAVDILADRLEQPLAAGDRLGSIIGASMAMRRLYPLIERCGAASTTVLINGETGTGKELIAEAIHATSARRTKSFVVVDCGALSHDLAESELFGHERGAFTGADARRIGAFERAHGGTIFLDEIGELPLTLQPLLLRALENRSIRRVGADEYRSVDVRVVAASHRDLRALVNAKRFRPDLYYRLDVVRIEVPPLRDRPGDVALLARQFWQQFRTDEAPAALIDHLATQSWPGNARELRNAVERAALLGWAGARVPSTEPVTYQQARERAVWEWERTWVEQLLAETGGNLSRAARQAKMGRSNLREIARRHGVARPSGLELGVDDPDET